MKSITTALILSAILLCVGCEDELKDRVAALETEDAALEAELAQLKEEIALLQLAVEAQLGGTSGIYSEPGLLRIGDVQILWGVEKVTMSGAGGYEFVFAAPFMEAPSVTTSGGGPIGRDSPNVVVNEVTRRGFTVTMGVAGPRPVYYEAIGFWL